MGGIAVLPSKTVADVDPADVAAFILPGGDRWERDPIEPELEALIERLDTGGVPIAAICGATVAVARLGLFRGRRHTSNGLDYLRGHVPGYADADHYNGRRQVGTPSERLSRRFESILDGDADQMKQTAFEMLVERVRA